jgi:hypothetical protein
VNPGDLAILLFLSLLAHGWGDYIIQTDWMATRKTSRWSPALWHAGTYTMPFVPMLLWPPMVPLSSGLIALAVIGGTHAVIDRYRLARHVIWAKNWLGGLRRPWAECSKTGFEPERPEWLTTWLMIIVDNIIHITINTLAIIWAVSS